MEHIKYPFLMLVGGSIYYNMEIIHRGYSHWTMAVVGGICFMLMGLVSEYNRRKLSFLGLMGISAMIITIVEFIAGVILNLWLQLNIWDYSELPFNLLGQICLPFTVLWFLLSFPAIFLNKYLRSWFSVNEDGKHKARDIVQP